LDNSTEFYYEIEEWTDTGFNIWVNISETITSLTDYKFLMYYNDSDAIDNQNPENVWESKYSVVLHMDEKSGTVYDSTSYNNNAYVQNNVNQDAAGKISGADNFDGVSGHLAIDDDSSLDLGSEGTIEAWINLDKIQYYGGFVHKGDKTDWSDESYSLQGWKTEPRIGAFLKGSTNVSLKGTNNTLKTGEWYYAVLTWGTFGVKLYLNDTEDASTTTTTTVRKTSGHINIGTQLNESGWYETDGTIDEVRISQTARNASWLKACFHTQNQTPGFLSFGPEITKPVENIPPKVEITNPEEGQTVSGIINIFGTAADSDGEVELVEVKIDEEAWKTATGTESWSIEWNTSNYTNGNHSIYARSYDGTNYSKIDIVNVTVENGIDNIPPTVKINTPELEKLYITLFGRTFKIPFPFITNSIILGKILVETEAVDNVGIESVRFYVDNILKENVTIPPYNWMWDEISQFLFLYDLKVVARDTSGNEATDIIDAWKLQVY
jgi:hypothetical protein